MSDLEVWLQDAEAWLEANATRRTPATAVEWAKGDDRVAVFHNLSFEEEQALIGESRAWQQKKCDAGYGSITWPVEYGGAGLSKAHEQGFAALERQFATPRAHEAVSISLTIEAPTIRALGTDEQKAKYLKPLVRLDELCCQLFSEPGAGSDLGSIGTRAVLDGDEWVVNGQKVWTSGARHANWGYLIARTSDDERQRALTAFVLPMDAPGVEIRPLKQMSGGASFNEVFFDDVRIPDSDRLGEVGGGWAAMMTTLGFERGSASGSGGGGGGGDLFDRLVLLAKHVGKSDDPMVRQQLAGAYTEARVRGWTTRRAVAKLRDGGVPGPEGSIGKLASTNGMQRVTALVSMLLGPALVADNGEWGTFAWSEYVSGVPGMRVAGGTDEIQRNTIAERALGLPREPRSLK